MFFIKKNLMYVTILFGIFLFFISYFSFVSQAFAETHVTDDIAINTNWAQADSPYIIDGPINILAGATLTIEPGVVVKFNLDFYNSSLYILGSLIANGTEDNKIYFTSNYDDTLGGNTDDYCFEDYDEFGNVIGTVCYDTGDPFVGDWDGVYLDNSHGSYFSNIVFKYADDTFTLYTSNASFNNLEISDAYTGITAYQNSELILNGGYIHDIQQDVITIFNNTTFNLTDVKIENVFDSVITVFNSSSFLATRLNINNMFVDYGDAIDVFNHSHLALDHSSLKVCPTYTCIALFDGYEYVDTPSSLYVDNSFLDGGFGNGIETFGDSNMLVTINNSSIKNFTGFGVVSWGNLTVVDAKNNYWGDATGPYHSTTNTTGLGNAVSNSVLFDPWLLVEPTDRPLHDPVILIPGISGSYINKNYGDHEEIWPNASQLVFSPTDAFLNDLALNIDGTENSLFPMSVGDIIREQSGAHVFDKLITELEAGGYVEGTDLFVFPYDWRKSNFDNAVLLKDKINQIITDTNKSKVDIVAHSMGGLVAKQYISSVGVDKVDRLIFLGTPHLGAPKAFKALMYGDDLGFGVQNPVDNTTNIIHFLNPERLKIIAQNMPGVYELLPSQKYITKNNGYIVNVIDKNNPITLDYNQTEDFMISKGRNAVMFPFGESLHNNADDLNLSGVEVSNFVGCGTKTIGGINTTQKLAHVGANYFMEDDFDLKYVNGDQTVPIVSADDIPNANVYFAKDITHGGLPSGDGVKEYVVAILKGIDIPTSPNILSDVSSCDESGKTVSTHSPVELHIYDEAENHSGPNIYGDIENNIDGVEYDVLEGANFAFLPDGVNYKIIIKATNTGGYDFKIKAQDENDNVTRIDDWKLIPLDTIQATGEINVGPSYPANQYQVKMDENGDGVVDKTIVINQVNDYKYYLNVLREIILQLNVKEKTKNELLAKVDKIQKKLEKNNKEKIVEKFTKFIQKLEKDKGKFKNMKSSGKESIIKSVNNLLEEIE